MMINNKMLILLKKQQHNKKSQNQLKFKRNKTLKLWRIRLLIKEKSKVSLKKHNTSKEAQIIIVGAITSEADITIIIIKIQGLIKTTANLKSNNITNRETTITKTRNILTKSTTNQKRPEMMATAAATQVLSQPLKSFRKSSLWNTSKNDE
jgi:hypothetical protein